MVWVFNVLLFLVFEFNQAQYQAMVGAGATCWSEISAPPVPGVGVVSEGPPPCFYNPTNNTEMYYTPPTKSTPSNNVQ
jgi:hypothetical protein